MEAKPFEMITRPQIASGLVDLIRPYLMMAVGDNGDWAANLE